MLCLDFLENLRNLLQYNREQWQPLKIVRIFLLIISQTRGAIKPP